MSRLMEYFSEVDKNAIMRAAHQIDPSASMTKFGLTAREQAAVVSGDAFQLAEAVGENAGQIAKLQVMHVPNTIYDELH